MKGVMVLSCFSPTAGEGAEEGPGLEMTPPATGTDELPAISGPKYPWQCLELVEGAGDVEGGMGKGVSAELCWIRPSAAHRIVWELGSHGYKRCRGDRDVRRQHPWVQLMGAQSRIPGAEHG